MLTKQKQKELAWKLWNVRYNKPKFASIARNKNIEVTAATISKWIKKIVADGGIIIKNVKNESKPRLLKLKYRCEKCGDEFPVEIDPYSQHHSQQLKLRMQLYCKICDSQTCYVLGPEKL